MKYYFFFFVLSGFLLITPAQDSCKTTTETHHGLQFQIGSLLYLTNFENYTFSYRYRFNNKSGLRVGILTNIDKQDFNVTRQIDSISIKPPDYNHYYNYKISIQYLHNLVNYESFSLILGGGPFFSYYKNESKSKSLSSSYTREGSFTQSTSGYGLDLIFGVEYRLTENVLISGEYSLTLDKESSDIDRWEKYVYDDPSQNSIYKENGTLDAFSTRGTGVNFGISIFF
ncbi:MAG TPA: outer membrane beta-barrel protein [Ignavibacteriaceae bacterium]|nr:outer membrane beta-barrel protein [Ignavibacteriaceae bacterium]